MVLAFFPIPGSPLKSKFSGPYVIEKCVNNHNYIIKTPDRRKSTQLVHVNMIKKYHNVPPTVLCCSKDTDVLDLSSTSKEVNPENEIISWSDYSNKEILRYLPQYLQHLNRRQQNDVITPLQQLKNVCGDVLIGMTSYYRRFCRNFSTVAYPLIKLTSPKIKFNWDESCDNSFQQIKSILCSKPVLTTPDLSKPFTLQVDASDHGIGAVLMQEKSGTKMLHPVSYYSCQLKASQRALSTVEKELLAIVQALQKFEVYFASNIPVTIMTDHNPLIFLNRMKNSNQKLLRWSLYLQNFNLNVKHIKEGNNHLADALSRIPVPEKSYF